jgi:hypothetical protein
MLSGGGAAAPLLGWEAKPPTLNLILENGMNIQKQRNLILTCLNKGAEEGNPEFKRALRYFEEGLFIKDVPVHVYIEGGVMQAAIGPEGLTVELLDKDAADVDGDEKIGFDRCDATVDRLLKAREVEYLW